MQENKPVLVVGLGNPGAEYARTRHNVGFMAVVRLAGPDAIWKNEKNARTSSQNIDDEMDFPIGKMREKTGGGSAGHNGIKSIDRAVGNEYRRIRIGIGHPRELGLAMSPADWVLGKFTDAQMQDVGKVIDDINLF